MLLAVLAVLLHTAGYALYASQVYAGSSVPNASSWTVWTITAALNAITFWRGAKDALAAAQFFAGSVACALVWAYALSAGKFGPLDAMGWTVLGLCAGACYLWWFKREASYANVFLAGIFLVSSVPTVAGVWNDPSVERALSWWFWTAACVCTTANVVRRRAPRIMLVMPVVLVIIHGVVALLARG